jgi:hypothetical protein
MLTIMTHKHVTQNKTNEEMHNSHIGGIWWHGPALGTIEFHPGTSPEDLWSFPGCSQPTPQANHKASSKAGYGSHGSPDS